MSEIGKAIRGILKKRREVAVVTLPEDGTEVGLRLLSDAEIAEANVDAFAWVAKECREKSVDVSKFIEANPDGFNRAQIHYMAMRAFRDPKDHSKPLFMSLDTVRDLDASYINAVWNMYLDLQDQRSPAKTLHEEEISAAVAAMVDDAALEHALAQMDAATLVRMARYMLRTAREAKTA